MKNNDLYEKLKELTRKNISISDLCDSLNLNELEVLAIVRELRNNGINIADRKKDDDIYLINQGDNEFEEENNYILSSDENNEFKFILISDTRLGSKYQQLSIINDIYTKGYSMGYKNVILCGNISEGLYSLNDPYVDTIFLDDTMRQTDYIINNYPQLKSMKTYFILGKQDEKHLKTNKINIGKRISQSRNDMIYLGCNSCNIMLDNTKIMLFSPKLSKTYTVSYRPQQQIDSFRSEDKPNILLYGGLLQMEKFTYRNVVVMSVPSVCATTKEMNDKRYSNTVGAWYVTIKTNKKGYLESIKAFDSVYYKTNKNDYQNCKTLRKTLV